jgi:hypothetical protein
VNGSPGGQGGGSTTAYGNGSSTYIALPNNAALKMTNPCVSIWIKTNTTDVDAICNNFALASSKYYGFGFWLTSSAPVGRVEMISGRGTGTVAGTDYSVAFSSSTYNDNNWHHLLAGHKAGDGIYFYKDGVADGYYAWAYSVGYTSTQNPRIFCRNDAGTNSDWFLGYLNSVTWIDSANISNANWAKSVYHWARYGGIGNYGDVSGYGFTDGGC